MLETTTVSLPTLLTVVLISVSWAGSIAAVYFNLKGRLDALQTRQADFSTRLQQGTDKFAILEERYREHSDRLIVVETLLSAMDDKLDSILTEVRGR